MQYLIIGAGPAGLAMGKALLEAQIEYDHVEANTALGGNWLHGVYQTVYTDASKALMAYPDFPLPAHWPEFLSQPQMLSYLNDYADTFNLKEHIRFNTRVVWIDAIANNLWQVHFQDGSQRIYQGVIICNGHHWDPNHTVLPGNFAGEYFHSKAYKTPDQLTGKRVLVVGSGNSAADIVCEAARVGKSAVMSVRDVPWIFPKSFRGIPLGSIKGRNAPQFLTPFLVKLLLNLTFGKHASYGLPKPKHHPFEKHPTVSEELPIYLRHGRVQIKPEIRSIEGKMVTFADGTSQEFDLIVGATGFKLSFPFLPKSLTRTEGKNLRVVGHCVYPDYKGLYFIGWQQIRGGVCSLAGAFSKVLVDLIRIEENYNLPAGQVLQAMGNTLSSTHLYGGNPIGKWIKKHAYQALEKAAKRLPAQAVHQNVLVEDEMPKSALQSRVN